MNSHSSDDNVRWRSVPSEDIEWVNWGSDHIAFHRPSGATHFLNCASRQLIDDILREPAELASILAAFGLSQSDTDWALQWDEMHAMLGQLERLGFVERL